MWIKVHGGPYQQAGIPDLLGCVEGRYVGLEVKVPGRENTVTKLQEAMLEAIRKNGGFSAVVSSVEQAEALVEEWLDTKR